MKGIKLRTALIIFATVSLSALAGCNGPAGGGKHLPGGRELLTVDFEEGESLTYKFVCRREIDIDWDPTGKASKGGKAASDKSTESLEVVMVYNPVEVDPYGLTTIEATCSSVKVQRSKRGGASGGRKDAAEYAGGKSFKLTVGPAGKIEDYSELDKLVQEMGEKAFRPNTDRGRIKEPEMIGDFVCTQWFLWDSVSSVQNAVEGVVVGDSWESQLSVPSPIVMRKARDVTYTVAEIRESEQGLLAVIDSNYTLAESVPKSWPVPYSGRFQMSGTFGFLGGYKILSLAGQGQELFNIDAGRTEQYNQQYEMVLDSSIPLGIDATPRISIKQTITAQLLRLP